jgi:DUF2975 family protein
MTPETEAEIRKVKKFGRSARQFCVLIAVVVGLSVPLSLLAIMAGPRWNTARIRIGPYLVTGDHLTPQLQAWSSLVVIATFSIVLWGLFHLHRLFAHLEAGEIYTKENVRHIRQVGLLALAMTVLQLVLPLLTFALIEVGFLDGALVTVADTGGNGGGALLFGTGSLSGFVTAGLVLLASWIMDVGRETSDEAATMRRDADLVI